MCDLSIRASFLLEREPTSDEVLDGRAGVHKFPGSCILDSGKFLADCRIPLLMLWTGKCLTQSGGIWRLTVGLGWLCQVSFISDEFNDIIEVA